MSRPSSSSAAADSLSDDEVNRHVRDIGEGEDKAQQSRHADQLGHQLRGISVKQSLDAVGAIGKQADRDDSPKPVGAVNRDGADRIIHAQNAVNEFDADADQQAGDEADDGGSQAC